MPDIEVRQAAEADLAALDRSFGSEFDRTHADDLADQAAGDKSFFIVLRDGAPVGHGLVTWNGPRAADVAAACPGCPEIYRLAVLDEHQGEGLGTALLEACIDEARARGCPEIGLGVGLENAGAIRLYKRHGFVQSAVTRYLDEYRTRRLYFFTRHVSEPCTWLVKPLPAD